jgi:hypothetical protein
MRLLTICAIALAITACNNKASVPETVTVEVKDSVQTVNVVHTIALSVQVTDWLRQACQQQVEQARVTAGLPPMSPEELDAAVNACLATSATNLINQLTGLINQAPQQ